MTKLLLLSLFATSLVYAEPVQFKFDTPTMGSLQCSIDQRVDGHINLSLAITDRLGCMPMGPSRVSARNDAIKGMMTSLWTSLGKAQGITCQPTSGYNLKETCELDAFLGYRWTEMAAGLNCVQAQAAKDSLCQAYATCRSALVQFLSRDGVDSVNTSLTNRTLKSDETVRAYDQFVKTNICP